ncbi:MAG TPA: S1C family serine protease [Stellaceae bacterium]|nr:S1C family serine protease [Stellaceae bacterium]
MTPSANPVAAFSEHLAGLVERAADSVVAVESGSRWPASGIHWRPGLVVTAEEALARDDEITLALPGGRSLPASLVGRDPTTDVALLRFEPGDLPAAALGDAGAARAGSIVVAVGSHDGAPAAALGLVAVAGGPWESRRGGTIDLLMRLDLRLPPGAEGGALIDAEGRVLGMAVSGPRRRALAIPRSTIDRVVDQLLAKGRIPRGYLGAGLHAVALGTRKGEAPASERKGGILVVSLDPEGPGARAGLLIGDVILAWNGTPVARVRDVMRLLGADSVGGTVRLALLRGGASAALDVVIGERMAAER